MALKQIMLKKQLESMRGTLDTFLEEEASLVQRSEELETIIEEAETEEELEAVQEEVDKIETEKETLEEKKTKLESEIAEIENEIEQLKSNEPKNTRKKEGNKKMEVRQAINEYVKSKGQTRADFTSVEGGALIPEELLTPQKALEDVIDLTKLVRVAKVNSGAGKYPVVSKSGGVMVSTAELATNPGLSVPNITEVAYDIETYRGYIPVSREVIDDADYDVTELIAEEISSQELNTKNAAVAAILKTATAKAVTGTDGLKSVFNIDLKKVYNAKAIVSASLYNELDTLKDLEGRYLLQPDIKSGSGKTLFGREVIVLDDDVIGTTAGDLVGFIGDPKEFAVLFDRKKASVKWTDHNVYGELLAGFVRFDVEVADTEAGFYVTYTPEA